VLAAWDKVRLKEGDDVLAWAFAMSKLCPRLPDPCRTEKYGLVASIANYLAEFKKDAPFFLPVQRLGDLLGVSAMTISNVICLLEKDRVVECVKQSNYAQQRAKEYRLAGGPVPVCLVKAAGEEE
jgi:hypothetical protein